MNFSLIDPAGGEFIFPVNPEEVTIRRSKLVETMNILRLGEIDLIQPGEKVKEIAFSSFFPKEYDNSFCKGDPLAFIEPQIAMNILTTFMVSQKPVRLIIAEDKNKMVNVLVTLSTHDTTIKGGEPGDIYFDITFRTWRDLKVRTETIAAKKGQVKALSVRPDVKPVAKVYIVKSGDTLTSIAKRELGDSSKWKQIYDKNSSVIGKDPNKIFPNQKLVMP
ncbi:LysM peptidoglycan-binding domain-containing protein [Cohnella silvisoli]|uniref:LysM peptidoglycan-binding domain-containing protein n=1 Tax=Cohnella silvisoli TaxID=2873699 RepID=A0ABV1L282_9BACL|nr:LysM peptidoglycan-binding domain-containing protein [Cohnella silvisoli]MCD9025745.1 LysM peptidoglycan-binding domain-containing protein [Cohnella silvisoli]